MIKILTVIAALLTVTMVSAREIVRIPVCESPPFLGKNLKHHGMLVDITARAFAEVGIKTEFGFFPCTRAFEYIRKGTWDAMPGWGHGAGREDIFYYTDSLNITSMHFFHLKSLKFDWEKPGDLAGLRIGITKGYNYGPQFEELKSKNIIITETVVSDELNLRKLLMGRFDIVPMEVIPAKYMMNKIFTPEEIDTITFHPKPVRQYGNHVIISRELGERGVFLVEQFNIGLSILREKGIIRQILEGD